MAPQEWEATSLSVFTFMHWRRKWQPTPVFLPGESQGRGSLVGCRLWGCTESDISPACWEPGFQAWAQSTCPELSVVLEKAEEPEIKLPSSAGSWKKQESSRKISHLAKEGSSLLLSVGSHDQGTCPRTGVTQFRRALPPLPGKGTRACCREKSSRRFPGVPKVSCFLKEQGRFPQRRT